MLVFSQDESKLVVVLTNDYESSWDIKKICFLPSQKLCHVSIVFAPTVYVKIVAVESKTFVTLSDSYANVFIDENCCDILAERKVLY